MYFNAVLLFPMIRIRLPSEARAKFLPVRLVRLEGAIALSGWFWRLLSEFTVRPDFHVRIVAVEENSAAKYNPLSLIEISVAPTVSPMIPAAL